MSDLANAAKTNDLKTLRRLLHDRETHFPPAQSKTDMQEACEAAALMNHPAAVKLLVDSGCWMSPDVIYNAVSGKSKDVIDILIAKGWNVNCRLGHIGDALIAATDWSDLDMVQFLLSRGADPNLNTDGGMCCALEQGAAISSIAVLDALLNAGAETKGRSALSKAAYWGRTDVVKFLLDRGLPIDDVPYNDDSLQDTWEYAVRNALCTAAWRGHADVVRLLLYYGADVGVKDSHGKSALELADAGGHAACINILKDHIGSKSEL